MTTAETHYIYQILEPTAKTVSEHPAGSIRKQPEVLEPVEALTEAEHDKRQDEYLKKHGVC